MKGNSVGNIEQTKNKNIEQAENEGSPPLGVMLDKARDEVGAMVLHYLNISGIPASIFDYVLADIVAKVKDLKASEYAALNGRGDRDGKHSIAAE